MVAETLPEAATVGGDELEAPHPLGALPEIEMRDEQARWPAVSRSERCVGETRRDQRAAADEVWVGTFVEYPPSQCAIT